MHGSGGGEGLCAYLLDPSMAGWDTEFDVSGPLDLSGNFSGGPQFANHVTVKESKVGSQNLASSLYEHEVLSTGDEEWRSVLVKFDIDDRHIDVEVDGHQVLKHVKLPEGMKIPRAACVAVCGGATNSDFMICVNDVKLVAQKDE